MQLHYLPLWCFLFERERQILYWLRLGRMYGSPSTATRKLTALSMPRTAGLSGSSRVWFMRRKPRDSTVAFTAGMAPMVLLRSVALIGRSPFEAAAAFFLGCVGFLSLLTSSPPGWVRRRWWPCLPGGAARQPAEPSAAVEGRPAWRARC